MAVSVVEFSHGLAAPFMWLSVGKLERNNERSDDESQRNCERSEDESQRNCERSDGKERHEHRHYLSQISVVLARCSPTEKLALEIGVAHTLCKK